MKALEYSDDEYQDHVNKLKITSMREVSSSSSACSRLLLIDELDPKLQGSPRELETKRSKPWVQVEAHDHY